MFWPFLHLLPTSPLRFAYSKGLIIATMLYFTVTLLLLGSALAAPMYPMKLYREPVGKHRWKTTYETVAKPAGRIYRWKEWSGLEKDEQVAAVKQAFKDPLVDHVYIYPSENGSPTKLDYSNRNWGEWAAAQDRAPPKSNNARYYVG